jgi:hypothetical protein
MKRVLIVTLCVAALSISQAAIVPVDLSPRGTGAVEGLSPSNEVPPVTNSAGSGGEILTGITYDTDARALALAVGFGSIAEFTDLSGPATAMHIHGPAGTDQNAGVVTNLSSIYLPAGDPAKGGVILGTVYLTPEQEAEFMAGQYYVNVHTALNPRGEIRGQLVPMVNIAPTISCPEPAVVECASPRGTPVSVSVVVADRNGDAMRVVWMVDGRRYQTNRVPATSPPAATTVTFDGMFGLGDHEVVASVTDGNSRPVSCSTTVTVQDTVAPVIESIRATPPVLWPPNHQMVPVTVRVRATDNCGRVRCRIVRITSNEATDGIGDGKTARDWRITGPLTALLRAERSGGAEGRVYTLTVECSDLSGNKIRGTVDVTVPHSQGNKKVK